MEVSVSSDASKSVIRLVGRFDFNAHREFRDAVENTLAQPGPSTVHLDMGEVSYLDSSALGMLLMARDKARGSGKTVSLANARGSVRQVLDIANFGKLFPLL